MNSNKNTYLICVFSKINVKNSDTKKLAMESRKMEERLTELKMAMDRDKETRQLEYNKFVIYNQVNLILKILKGI